MLYIYCLILFIIEVSFICLEGALMDLKGENLSNIYALMILLDVAVRNVNQEIGS